MKKEDLVHLEKLMDFLAAHFVRKNAWKDVSKSEWTHIAEELNKLLEEQNRRHRDKERCRSIGYELFVRTSYY